MNGCAGTVVGNRKNTVLVSVCHFDFGATWKFYSVFELTLSIAKSNLSAVANLKTAHSFIKDVLISFLFLLRK